MITKCVECNGAIGKLIGANKGVAYSTYKCNACGEEIMDMAQARTYMKQAENNYRKKQFKISPVGA